MLWRSGSCSAKDQSGDPRGRGIVSDQQIESVFALAMGFAIASCWSVMSGVVVAMALTTFGLSAG
jgi:hypothetical protein